jgi:Rrf2 family iron-sulfur cluster assembly transcriptional regulator
MADLARHSGDSRPEPVRLSEIADRQEISLAYLEQLFAKLRRGGLVSAERGPRGGYRLARSAGEIGIAEIVMAVNEPIKATRCASESDKGCLGRRGRCLTHDLWEELGHQIEFFLASITLADVIEHRVQGRARALAAAGAPSVAA